MPDGTEMPGATHEGLGFTESLPQVGFGNTIGVSGAFFLAAAGIGLVTYSEYRSSNNTLKSWVPRLKRAGIYGAVGAGAGLVLQTFVAGGQYTGEY